MLVVPEEIATINFSCFVLFSFVSTLSMTMSLTIQVHCLVCLPWMLIILYISAMVLYVHIPSHMKLGIRREEAVIKYVELLTPESR